MENFSSVGISEQTAREAVQCQPRVRPATQRKQKRNVLEKVLRYKAAALGAVAVFVLLIVMFLFSLPTAMFETVQSFVEDAGDWAELDSAVREKWSWFKNSRTTYDSGENETDDISTLDSEDVFVVRDETSQTDALMTKVQFTIDKSSARANALAKEGELESRAESTVAAAWPDYKPADSETKDSRYDYTDSRKWYWDSNIDGWNYWTVRTYYTDVYETKYVYGGTNFNLSVLPLSRVQAVSLLCTATVAEGAAITGMENSDYALWLGYKPGFLTGIFGSGHRVTADLGDFGTVTVRRWDGTCLPVFMTDYLKEHESVRNRYYRDYGCAALDALVYISTPDLADVMTAPTKTSSVSTSTTLTEAEHTVTVEYAENSSGEKYVKTHSVWEEEEITTVTETVECVYNVTFTIGYRDPEVLNDLMGFTVDGFEPEEESNAE